MELCGISAALIVLRFLFVVNLQNSSWVVSNRGANGRLTEHCSQRPDGNTTSDSTGPLLSGIIGSTRCRFRDSLRWSGLLVKAVGIVKQSR